MATPKPTPRPERRSWFELVRTDAGWHVRLVGLNGEIVMSSEVYTRRATAQAVFALCRGLLGAAVCVVLGLIVVTVLDDLGENHEGPGAVPYGSPTGWWPDADEPIDLELTALGQVAADLPGAFLDERAETWGPAAP